MREKRRDACVCVCGNLAGSCWILLVFLHSLLSLSLPLLLPSATLPLPASHIVIDEDDRVGQDHRPRPLVEKGALGLPGIVPDADRGRQQQPLLNLVRPGHPALGRRELAGGGDAKKLVGQVEREGPLVWSHEDLGGGGSRYRGLGV